MMSYSNYGTRNQDFEVWGKSVVLPMAGKVVTVQRDVSILQTSSENINTYFVFQEIDNAPDVNAAVEVEDAADGSEVDLQELPQNMIEVEVGGAGSPFLLRLIHFKQSTIPDTITVILLGLGAVRPWVINLTKQK